MKYLFYSKVNKLKRSKEWQFQDICKTKYITCIGNILFDVVKSFLFKNESPISTTTPNLIVYGFSAFLYLAKKFYFENKMLILSQFPSCLQKVKGGSCLFYFQKFIAKKSHSKEKKLHCIMPNLKNFIGLLHLQINGFPPFDTQRMFFCFHLEDLLSFIHFLIYFKKDSLFLKNCFWKNTVFKSKF